MIEFFAVVYLFIGSGLAFTGWLLARDEKEYDKSGGYASWWATFLIFTATWGFMLIYHIGQAIVRAIGDSLEKKRQKRKLLLEFEKELENPSEPNEKLKEAMKKRPLWDA